MRSDFFLDPSRSSVSRLPAYLLTIIIILVSYVIIGQIPFRLYLTNHPEALPLYAAGDLKGLSELIGENTLLIFLLIPFVITLIAFLISIRFVHKWTILSAFTSAKSFDLKRFIFSFFLWGSVLTVFLGFTHFSIGNIVWNFNAKTFPFLLLISLLIIPIQTTCEEVLFRGYLMKGLMASTGKPWIVVLVSGIVFGLMHAANPEITALGFIAISYYILTGIFLGLMVWKDNGLELSMGYHAANNIFTALIITNDWQAFQTDALFKDLNPPSFGWDSILTVALVQPLIIVIFSKIYKWKWRSEETNAPSFNE